MSVNNPSLNYWVIIFAVLAVIVYLASLAETPASEDPITTDMGYNFDANKGITNQ